LETAAREAVQQPMKVGAGSTVADVTVRPDDLTGLGCRVGGELAAG
jgi:hypothetical protein